MDFQDMTLKDCEFSIDILYSQLSTDSIRKLVDVESTIGLIDNLRHTYLNLQIPLSIPEKNKNLKNYQDFMKKCIVCCDFVEKQMPYCN